MDFMNGKNILVVDDDSMSLKLAQFILTQNSFSVQTASSGEACIEILKSAGSVDLVLLDIEMPGMNGVETLEKIREDSAIAGTKVIFLTACEFSRYAAEAERLNVSAFISKPLYSVEIMERVKSVLQSGAAASREKILVVDDDPMTLKFTQHMLGKAYDVECASSYKEAFVCLANELPSLILLDFMMPGMNGLELLAEIRKIKGCADLPVVFLTGENDRETEIQVFRAGALDYIQKPIVAEVVHERIKRILSLRKLQESLENEVQKRTAELEESRRKHEILSLQVVKTLASTIDAKDRYTNGHSSRVAKYSKIIAQKMGKSLEEQNEIYFVGLLHDIGKIGIPDSIINKTSKLTDEEFAQIKRHPQIGVGILQNISEMPNIEVGAHYHHERYDGRGYPEGLSGNAIPEIARIIAVADSYDAMTSRRSYRAALPQSVVREEIVKGRGTQFDPLFADMMIEMIDADTNYEMRDEGSNG